MPEDSQGPDGISPESPGSPGSKPLDSKAAPGAEVSSTAPPTHKPATPGAASQPTEPAAKADPVAANPAEAANVDAPKVEAPKAAAPAAPKPPVAKPAAKPEGPKPLPWESELVTRLRAQYGSGLKEASTYVGQKYLVVDSSIVYEVLLQMNHDERFDYCVDITAVHYPTRERRL